MDKFIGIFQKKNIHCNKIYSVLVCYEMSLFCSEIFKFTPIKSFFNFLCFNKINLLQFLMLF